MARIHHVLNGRIRLVPAFQPIADLATGRIRGFEALARFSTEPARAPDAWFAEATAAGLGVDLEMMAASAALDSLPALHPDVFLSINLSPQSLVSGRPDELLRQIGSGQVVIEVTEHAPVTDYPRLKDALVACRSRGVRVAIDDAGAGFASLRHVLRLDPDLVKLDISITRGIDAERSNRSLATALVSFARDRGVELVAEGAETVEEVATLNALGIRLVQGNIIGRPGPIPRELTLSTFGGTP